MSACPLCSSFERELIIVFKLMSANQSDLDLHESQENDHVVDNICDLTDHIR